MPGDSASKKQGMRLKRPQIEELADLARLLDTGLVDRFAVAVDGGAHVGGWSRALAARFGAVFAIEPAEDTFTALEANVADLGNVTPLRMALWDREATVTMVAPGRSNALTARYAKAATTEGDREVCGALAGTLDGLGLAGCDFLKLDLEGAEHLAIAGGRKTIAAHRPFVLIEEFGHEHRYTRKARPASALLVSMGYEQVWDAGPNIGFKHRGD